MCNRLSGLPFTNCVDSKTFVIGTTKFKSRNISAERHGISRAHKSRTLQPRSESTRKMAASTSARTQLIWLFSAAHFSAVSPFCDMFAEWYICAQKSNTCRCIKNCRSFSVSRNYHKNTACPKRLARYGDFVETQVQNTHSTGTQHANSKKKEK